MTDNEKGMQSNHNGGRLGDHVKIEDLPARGDTPAKRIVQKGSKTPTEPETYESNHNGGIHGR